MTETIRSFIAIDIPEPLRDTIRRVQRQLKSSGLRMNWVPPENIHLTLKFLGDITPAEIDPILAILHRCGSLDEPFTVEVQGAGVFPDLRRPRVFWIGSGKGSAELRRMRMYLDVEIQKATAGRIRSESRPFRGHLTLARIRQAPNPGRLVTAIRQVESVRFDPISVAELSLFESRLQPAGAVYTRIGRIPIGKMNPKPDDSNPFLPLNHS